MIGKLIKLIVFALILTTSVVLAADVTISPSNPTSTQDLSCYVNGHLCNSHVDCNAHWIINKHEVLVAPILPASYTNAGDKIKCKAWVLGELVDSAKVTIRNSPPIVSDIPDVVMDEDTTYTINLNNYVSDSDGNRISWSVSGNANINVVITNGVATLTPNAGWNGQETLTFTANDGHGGTDSDSVLVTINPSTHDIILNDIPDAVMNENTDYVLDLTSYIVDVDGDLQSITVSGNVNINAAVDFASRTITLTPNTNWDGQETLTITVNDLTSSDSDSFLVTVNHVDDAPVITSFNPNQMSVDINEGDSLLFSIIASDPEGDALTYTWELDGNNVETGTSYLYDSLDGPDSHDLEVSITDGTNTITHSWVINEINVNPSANANGPYVCNIGHNVILRGSATDPGQDILDYEWDLNNDGTYEGSGQTLLINCGFLGIFPINLRVTDDDGGVDTDSTTLTVTSASVNNQPYFDPHLADQNAVVGTLFNYDIDAYDADGDALTYSDNAAQFDINPNTGLISFTPLTAGIISATITVCDGSGFPNACNSESFNIHVSQTSNTAPVVQILLPTDGQSFVFGNNIFFNGIGNDAEDGSLTGSALQWTSNHDGNIGQGESFSTSTLSIGTHLINLVGTDSDGASGSDSVSITILSPGGLLAPVAVAGNDVNTNVGSIVTFNGSASHDPDGNIVSYQWNFGDGGSASGAVVQHSYSSAGTYTARLTVTDNDGLTNSDTLIVNVLSGGSSGIGVSSYTKFASRNHEFNIKEIKVMSNVKAGEEVKILVEIENTGYYDENINLRLKASRLLLIKEFGEYEVESGKSKNIILSFKLPEDASGVYDINLEAYNDDFETSRTIELDSSGRGEFVNLITGGAAGYNIEVEESNAGAWILSILILIVSALIVVGTLKIFK